MWLDKKIIKVLDLNKLWTLLEFIFYSVFRGINLLWEQQSWW